MSHSYDIELVNVFNKLKNQWIEFLEKKKPYWVMKHQLIGLCSKDQQQAQKDLDLLLADGLFRQFLLPLSHREMLIMKWDDFESIVRQILTPSVPTEWLDSLIAWLCSSSKSDSSSNFPWPLTNIISQDEIVKSLKLLIENVEITIRHESKRKVRHRAGNGESRKSLGYPKNDSLIKSDFPHVINNDNLLKFLIHQGFLRRLQGLRYTIAVPGCGAFVSNLTQGRKTITNLLKRKNSQILLTDMVSRYKASVDSTFLSMEYLLSDMLNIGIIKAIPGPSGDFLSLG